MDESVTMDLNSTYQESGDYMYFIDFVREKVVPQTHEWFIIALYALILLLALGGNTLVCYAVLRNEHMRTVTNYYIVNLSVADILVSLLCLGPTAAVDVTETWWLGKVGCKVIPFFQHVAACVSIYTLTAIAADRYLVICHPLKFRIRASRTVIIICLIWIWSVIAILPQMKWQGSMLQKVYYVGIVIFTYLAPLCIITVAYAKVCIRLWSAIPTEETSRTKPSESGGNQSANWAASEGGATKPGAVKTGTETQIASRRKVARMLIVVAFIFAVCYLPINVTNTIRHFGLMDTNTHDVAHRTRVHLSFLASHLLLYINSAINPFIYNFLSVKFRREFRMAFSTCVCCRSRKRRPDTIGLTSASTTASRRAHRTNTTGRTTSTEYTPMWKVALRSNRPQSSSSEY
ncbi:orexin receptor type 2-like [Diadema antillarum]|uniref:orexin receptor type 2-like n=1 Tax=Diadema antillarum TaxID=105358 RepID=UPI003A86C758